jgi:hypothetical protein
MDMPPNTAANRLPPHFLLRCCPNCPRHQSAAAGSDFEPRRRSVSRSAFAVDLTM